MTVFIKPPMMCMLQRRFYKNCLCSCIDYYGFVNHPSLKNCHFYWIIFTFESLSLSLPPLNPPLSSCHASLSFRFSFIHSSLKPSLPQCQPYASNSHNFSSHNNYSLNFSFRCFFFGRELNQMEEAQEIFANQPAPLEARGGGRRRRKTQCRGRPRRTRLRFGGTNAPQPP